MKLTFSKNPEIINYSIIISGKKNIEKGRVKNLWKLEACGKLLRLRKPIFLKNYNFGSNLKNGYFGPKIGFWFIDYGNESISNKILQSTEIIRRYQK